MNAGIEEIALEDLVGYESPQCEILFAPDFTTECVRSAVARVRYTCTSCGHSGHMFLCEECLEDLKFGLIGCSKCEQPGCTWTEI